MKKKVSILIVDDHPFFVYGLKDAISQNQDLNVVGEAADGIEAVEKAKNYHPDIILMDIILPRKSGVQAIKEILADDPGAKILVFSGYSDDETILEAIRNGASGYLLKSAPIEDVVFSIRELSSGRLILQNEVIQKLFFEIRRETEKSKEIKKLSSREIEVLRLVGSGASNRTISQTLNITHGTVRSHINHILRKLDLTNRAQLILFAVRERLVCPDTHMDTSSSGSTNSDLRSMQDDD